MRHAYGGRLKKQKEKSQQRMSKDDHYSVSATNRKSRNRVIANNVQEVLSEKARLDEEILKAAYSKKKKTNKTPSHSNTTKTSTATSAEEAAQTTTTTTTTTTELTAPFPQPPICSYLALLPSLGLLRYIQKFFLIFY